MAHAVFTGSFDPITLGHVDLVRRVRPYFDRLTVLIANSSSKNYLFSPEERRELVALSLAEIPAVEIDFCQGLTVDYMRAHQATVMIRGLRSMGDFDQERSLAEMNKGLYPAVETFFILAAPQYQGIASRLVKEAAGLGASVKAFVPSAVEQALRKKLKK